MLQLPIALFVIKIRTSIQNLPPTARVALQLAAVTLGTFPCWSMEGEEPYTQVQLTSSSDIISRPAQHTPKSTQYFKGKLPWLVVSHARGFRGRGQSQTNAKGTWLSEIALIQQMRNQHTKQPVGWERTFTASFSLSQILVTRKGFPDPGPILIIKMGICFATED